MRDSRLQPIDVVRLDEAVRQDRSVQASAVGMALAQRKPSQEELAGIHKQMRGLPWHEFEGAFVKCLAGDLRSEWIQFILTRFDVRLENIDCLFVRTNGDVVEAINDEAREWDIRRRIEPWAIWTDSWPHVNLAEYWLLRLLPQIDLRAWLDATEYIRSPSWLGAIGAASEIKLDRLLLLQVVKEAGKAFDDWRPTGNVVALIATRWVVEHAKQLNNVFEGKSRQDEVDGLQELQQFRAKELPDYLDMAFETLLAREDGGPLAMHLSAHLGETITRPSSRGTWIAADPANFDIDVHIVDRLALAIRNHGFSLKQFRQLDGKRDRAAKDWNLKKPVTNTVSSLQPPEHQVVPVTGEADRIRSASALPVWLAAFAHVYANEPARTDELNELWNLLTMVLSSRDAGFQLVRNDETHSVRVVEWMAHVLANTGRSVELWNKAYGDLEPQRRQAQFAYRYGQYDANEPSWVLARVGLRACWLLPDNLQFERVALYRAVETAIRRLWLTCRQEIGLDWRMLYAKCMASVFEVFHEEAEGELSFLWQRVVSNRWLVCASAAMLLDQGISVESLRNAATAAALDLCALLDEQRNWVNRAAELEYPPGFDKLLDALRRQN